MSSSNVENPPETIDLSKTSSSEALTLESQQTTTPSANCSPKSQGNSPNSKGRRKRNSKKLSTSQDDNEGNNATEIEPELAAKPSTNSVITLSSDSTKNESDCETIEKIAKMVSNITQNESSSQEVINEVENRLEELFAGETTNVPQQSNIILSEPASNVEPNVATLENGSIENSSTLKGKTLKVVKPRTPKMKKLNGKKQNQKKNGSKAKDNKKNDKSGKSKVNGDKNEGKKSHKSKENGGKSKVKPDVAPYLQISKDGSFTIVNQTVNGDDDTDKATSKQKKPATTEKHKHIRGLHVSTLSNKYDADKRDASWICVFCKLGPHKYKLGDLFGPYLISKTSSEYSLCLEDPANDIFRQSNKGKFSQAKLPLVSPPKKKRKNSEGPQRKLTSPAVLAPDINDEVFTGMTAVDENTYEIWFHEDCISWAQGTYIIGTKIIGMEAAVWQSTRHRCEYCQKNGAMMCCLSRGCTKESHYVCATWKSWKMCEDFKTYCDQHIL